MSNENRRILLVNALRMLDHDEMVKHIVDVFARLDKKNKEKVINLLKHEKKNSNHCRA